VRPAAYAAWRPAATTPGIRAVRPRLPGQNVANLHLYLAAAVRDNGAGRAIATELSAAKARACAVSSSQRGTEAARELGVTFIHIDPTDDYSVCTSASQGDTKAAATSTFTPVCGRSVPRCSGRESP
jgi:hypothetical protein